MRIDPDLEWLWDHGSVEDVELVTSTVLGKPLREFLGDAYHDVEQMTVEEHMGIEHPSHTKICNRLAARFGPDEAATACLGMSLLVRAQARRGREIECWANATLDGKHHFMSWIGDEANARCDCGATPPKDEDDGRTISEVD